jgi:hypothetical protein
LRKGLFLARTINKYQRTLIIIPNYSPGIYGYYIPLVKLILNIVFVISFIKIMYNFLLNRTSINKEGNFV